MRFEMSKHSIRSGSASRASASRRRSSASLRCWRERSSLSRSVSSASFAFRVARSRIRRFVAALGARPRPAAARSVSSSRETGSVTWPDDDPPGSRVAV
jgi:hypothetical protein